jgi:hypothetical protein
LFYLLDNEPGMWHIAHRDLFPVGIKMEDLMSREVAAAKLIKRSDSYLGGLVAGPEERGLTGLLYSGYDIQWASVHGWDKALPDRASHGDMEYAPWLLKQFARAEKDGGTRLLDVFTAHYSPQAAGVASDDVSDATKRRRNESTRALWDPSYKEGHGKESAINLIPRMRNWGREYYPKTEIGITDYDFGAAGSISGALAEADALGIYGREGVALALRSALQGNDTPTFKAMQMYTNCDGNHDIVFGNESMRCVGGNPDEMSAYASSDAERAYVTVMLINKRLSGATNVRVQLKQMLVSNIAAAYQLTSANKIVKLPDVPVNDAVAMIRLPPESITLLVVGNK